MQDGQAAGPLWGRDLPALFNSPHDALDLLPQHSFESQASPTKQPRLMQCSALQCSSCINGRPRLCPRHLQQPRGMFPIRDPHGVRGPVTVFIALHTCPLALLHGLRLFFVRRPGPSQLQGKQNGRRCRCHFLALLGARAALTQALVLLILCTPPFAFFCRGMSSAFALLSAFPLPLPVSHFDGILVIWPKGIQKDRG